MKRPRTPVSTYVTLHTSIVPRSDGSYAVSLVERRWKNGAKDSGRVLHRGTISSEARPGSHDELLWMAGVYLQQLSAKGVVTQIGGATPPEAGREPRGAVGGG